MTDAITIQNPRNRDGSTGHVLAKRSVTFTEIRTLYEITSMRQFARLTLSAPIPEDTTIMNFRHLLEKHQLAAGILETINAYLQDKGLSLRQGTIVDATIIHAPSSTKNKEG